MNRANDPATRELLFLAHRIPYPPNKGDKIRSYHMLRHLAYHWRIHLATFVDDPADWQYADHVRGLCHSAYIAPLKGSVARLRSVTGLFSGEPLTLPYYRHRGLQEWVGTLLNSRPVQRVFVFSSAMAQYVPPPFRDRTVVDFVDVDSDKWRQYAPRHRGPLGWIYRREGERLEAYERTVAEQCAASLFVSDAESALFRRLAPECASKVHYVGNGVDLDYFTPERVPDSPYAAGERALVFTGAMDYWPNIDAVTWFAHEIFPAIRDQHPDSRFYIVGSRPAPAVRALAEIPGVHVTGAVPDVRPYLAHAAMAVAPLRVARGIQNKVLEAMAMARPVVVTAEALEGVDAEPGREVMLARTGPGLASAVCDLLNGVPDGLGERARARVRGDYAWSAQLARLDGYLAGGVPVAGFAGTGTAGDANRPACSHG